MRLDIKIFGIYHETSSPGGERAISQVVWMGCAVRAASHPNEFITREIRGTRLPVIRVKEKEVSASTPVRMRLRGGGRRRMGKGRRGGLERWERGGWKWASKALTKGNGDIYRGRAGYKGGTCIW